MVIVENRDRFNQFLGKFNEKDSLIIPIFGSDELHPSISGLTALFIGFEDLNSFDFYLLPFHHMDCINLPTEYLDELGKSEVNKYVFNTKSLLQQVNLQNYRDIESLNYLSSNEPLEPIANLDMLIRKIRVRSLKDPDIMKIVPITKIIEYCIELFHEFYSMIANSPTSPGSDSYLFINKTIIPSLAQLEKTGLQVDYQRFIDIFGERLDKHIRHSKVNSQYNIFTATGRPANRFASVNYAALKKEGGERKPFVSRFAEDGMLVMFDYDAYHLRLLSNLIKYDFGKENIHEHLAKQYFDTDTVTTEQYNESKQKTFKILYGGVPKEWEYIPFFSKAKDYTESLFDLYSQGKLFSIISGRRIVVDDPNPQKVLNYLIQLYETEHNMTVIHKIHEYLRDYETKLALYTYDSFLFDFSIKDGKERLSELKKIIESDEKFYTKAYYGKNYDNMTGILIK